MRAALYLLAALAATAYHLVAGSLVLGIALIGCVSLYGVARGYAARTMRRSDPEPNP